jgi:hypothetical protein
VVFTESACDTGYEYIVHTTIQGMSSSGGILEREGKEIKTTLE